MGWEAVEHSTRTLPSSLHHSLRFSSRINSTRHSTAFYAASTTVELIPADPMHSVAPCRLNSDFSSIPFRPRTRFLIAPFDLILLVPAYGLTLHRDRTQPVPPERRGVGDVGSRTEVCLNWQMGHRHTHTGTAAAGADGKLEPLASGNARAHAHQRLPHELLEFDRFTRPRARIQDGTVEDSLALAFVLACSARRRA
ncbi:hypothetical protein C8R45DRAFT_1219673 [Mycena sanguinolenta]|nr:hypothetical protein C8R45DRAFT_1219673 [Mycena sanguinolenta]